MAGLLGAVVGAAPAAAACPDGGYAGVPGQRIKTPTSSAVYMVDPEGYRRLIPDADTYGGMFRDWSGIITDSNALCVWAGSPIEPSWDSLIKSASGPQYYFLETHPSGVQEARWIPSGAIFNKYNFRWDVPTVSQDTIDSLRGRDWWR